ncbi:SEP-domain-containing protein, partial [Ramicandelaber brevisporus]
IRLYRTGFTVDDGPLREFTDPANVAAMNSISRGMVPRDLVPNITEDQQVVVELKGGLNDEYRPSAKPKPRTAAFTGTGMRLGSASSPVAPTSPPSTIATASGTTAATTTTTTTTATATAAATDSIVPKLVVDPAQPQTTIQVRLADGTRMVVRVNHSATIAQIRQFIIDSQPPAERAANRRFTLRTLAPPRPLEDESKTVAEAKLLGSVIVQ